MKTFHFSCGDSTDGPIVYCNVYFNTDRLSIADIDEEGG